MNPLAVIKAVLICLFFLYFALGEIAPGAGRIMRKAVAAAERMDEQGQARDKIVIRNCWGSGR